MVTSKHVIIISTGLCGYYRIFVLHTTIQGVLKRNRHWWSSNVSTSYNGRFLHSIRNWLILDKYSTGYLLSGSSVRPDVLSSIPPGGVMGVHC